MPAFYTLMLCISASHAFADETLDLERLRAGETVISDTRHDESGGTVRIRILVQASARRIWDVISSCQHAFQYLAGLQDCEILEDEPSRALTRHVIDSGVFMPTMDYTFETRRRPYTQMDLELVEGNLKAMDGYWRFQPFESGVLLEHEVHVRPRTPAPRWLVRKTLKSDLPDMMLCIRGLSGGSLDVAMEASDLEACQAPVQRHHQ